MKLGCLAVNSPSLRPHARVHIRPQSANRANIAGIGASAPAWSSLRPALIGRSALSGTRLAVFASSAPKRRAVRTQATIVSSLEGRREEISSLTIPELKDVLRGYSLKVGGKKAELIDRIIDHEASSAPAAASDPRAAETNNVSPFVTKGPSSSNDGDEWKNVGYYNEEDDDEDEDDLIVDQGGAFSTAQDAWGAILEDSEEEEEEEITYLIDPEVRYGELMKMTVGKGLKDLCARYKLENWGKKGDLVERILDYELSDEHAAYLEVKNVCSRWRRRQPHPVDTGRHEGQSINITLLLGAMADMSEEDAREGYSEETQDTVDVQLEALAGTIASLYKEEWEDTWYSDQMEDMVEQERLRVVVDLDVGASRMWLVVSRLSEEGGYVEEEVDETSAAMSVLGKYQRGRDLRKRYRYLLKEARGNYKVTKKTRRMQEGMKAKQISLDSYKGILGELVEGEVVAFREMSLPSMDDPDNSARRPKAPRGSAPPGSPYIILEVEEGLRAVIPPEGQVAGEDIRVGDRVAGILRQVLPISSGTPLVLSRLGKRFVARLLEEAVPEIRAGDIEIRRIARLPGTLTKVAVDLSEEAASRGPSSGSGGRSRTVDPVTACLGRGGARAQQVQGELGELLNIVRYFEDPRMFIAASLLPAQVRPDDVVVKSASDPGNERSLGAAEVYVPPPDLRRAIGKGGMNVRAAASLTQHNITLEEPDEEEDGSELLRAEVPALTDDFLESLFGKGKVVPGPIPSQEELEAKAGSEFDDNDDDIEEGIEGGEDEGEEHAAGGGGDAWLGGAAGAGPSAVADLGGLGAGAGGAGPGGEEEEEEEDGLSLFSEWDEPARRGGGGGGAEGGGSVNTDWLDDLINNADLDDDDDDGEKKGGGRRSGPSWDEEDDFMEMDES